MWYFSHCIDCNAVTVQIKALMKPSFLFSSLSVNVVFLIDSEQSDTESNNGIDASTGTCLGQSAVLPGGILQIKRFKDVNNDRPAKVFCVIR